jgi:hypothetical protein
MQATTMVPNANTCANATRIALNDFNTTYQNDDDLRNLKSEDVFAVTNVISTSMAEAVY